MDAAPDPLLRALLALPVASLGTLHEGAPLVTMVPVALLPARQAFLIHVSRLAAHTRDLQADPRVGLLFTAPLEGQDPLSLPRLSLQGVAKPLPEGERAAAEGAYLARFPKAELTLGLGDFGFYTIRPASGRLVLGFGRAQTLDASQVLAGLAI